MLRHKVGAAVVAVRRAGGIPTFDQLNNYIDHSEMLIPASNYWNVINGRLPGEVMQDEEGIVKSLKEKKKYLLILFVKGSGVLWEA